MTIIRRFHLEPRNEPAVDLARRILVDGVTFEGNDYGLNIDAPYQREPVWGESRRRNLIRSLLMGLSVGIITLAERPFPEWKAVVDGKQRLLTIRAFYLDEFAVPRDWWRESDLRGHPANEVSDVFYSDLTPQGRRIFDSQATIQTNTAKGLSLADEEELFTLVNYGGVPQGSSDLV